MHETYQRCIFTKLCVMKIQPDIMYTYLHQPYTATTKQ